MSLSGFRRWLAKRGAITGKCFFKYPIDLRHDPNGQYLVTIPDIPKAATAADSREETLMMAVYVLESALDFCFDKKRLVPPPSSIERGQTFIDLLATVHNEMLTKGVKKAVLARCMKMVVSNFDWIFHAKHGAKFETFEAAFAALGKKIKISIR